MDEEEKRETMAYLESVNAVYPYGMDEEGEVIYRFNMDILQVAMPELYDAIMEDLDRDLMKLYEMGVVEIEYDENLNAKFRISQKGYHYITTGELLEDDTDGQ